MFEVAQRLREKLVSFSFRLFLFSFFIYISLNPIASAERKEIFPAAHSTNLHYKKLNTLYDMPLASRAKGPQGSSQRSESCTGSDCSRVDDAMPDASTQPDTATTTPIECKLPTITMDYERIDTYLTEIGAPDEIVDALDRITCLAQHVWEGS